MIGANGEIADLFSRKLISDLSTRTVNPNQYGVSGSALLNPVPHTINI